MLHLCNSTNIFRAAKRRGVVRRSCARNNFQVLKVRGSFSALQPSFSSDIGTPYDTMLAGVLPFPAEVAKAVDEYCCSHSTALPPHLAEHKAWTAENYESPDRMSSSLQAQLFIFLASDRRAKRILDIGSFSGYSALAWKEGMKALGGEVWTLEKDPVMVDACAKALEKYDAEGKIHLVPGPATDT